MYCPRRPAPTRGALRGRHGRWERDAVDAAGARDECTERGRRSRVVLMPRRWRQVSDNAAHCAGDGDKKADHRGEHEGHR